MLDASILNDKAIMELERRAYWVIYILEKFDDLLISSNPG